MKPVFIGGCERSGTTMLGTMLGGHSHCLCLPESQFMDDQLAHADSDGRIDPRAALGRILAHERFRLLWDLPLDPAQIQPAEFGTALPELWNGLAQAYGRKVGQPAAEVWIDHTPNELQTDTWSAPPFSRGAFHSSGSRWAGRSGFVASARLGPQQRPSRGRVLDGALCPWLGGGTGPGARSGSADALRRCPAGAGEQPASDYLLHWTGLRAGNGVSQCFQTYQVSRAPTPPGGTGADSVACCGMATGLEPARGRNVRG